MEVKISSGNSKLGSIPSVSLPAGLTCRNDCKCKKRCYANRIERLRKTVREAYRHNYKLLKEKPDTYWREVEASIMMSRFCRFHVSGDIPDKDYLCNIIEIADRNPHCEILCFTKKFEIVNDIMHGLVTQDKHLPTNLHLILSGWRDFNFTNPYNLPEAHVRYKDGYTTARDEAKECGGNCTECAITDDGCWTLKPGEQVIFNEH